MVHIRSQFSPAQLYSAREHRAWGSLLLSAAGLASCLVAGLHTQRMVLRAGSAPTLCATLVEETTPAPAEHPQVSWESVPPPPAEPSFPTMETGIAPLPPGELPLFPAGEALVVAPLSPLSAPESIGEPSTPAPKASHRAISSAPAPADQAPLTPPAYKETPRPPYPPGMRASRTEGDVRVRIAVDAEGHPTQVDILGSSGHREFDTTARDWILRHWRFTPAHRAGKPIPGLVSTQVRFVIGN